MTNLVLRSLHIDPAVDSDFRRFAFRLGIPKAELQRRILSVGHQMLEEMEPKGLSLSELERQLSELPGLVQAGTQAVHTVQPRRSPAQTAAVEYARAAAETNLAEAITVPTATPAAGSRKRRGQG